MKWEQRKEGKMEREREYTLERRADVALAAAWAKRHFGDKVENLTGEHSSCLGWHLSVH